MSIELVVFDIAGTTVSDRGDINNVFRQAFVNAGITNVDAGDINKVMGYRKKEAIKILLEKYKPGFENDEQLIEVIHEDFSRQMIQYYETSEDLKPFPFAEKVFQDLQSNKIKVALNTGFTKAVTESILKRLHWDQASFIDHVICSDEVIEGRPYPYMIQYLMQTMNIESPESVAKVGDTKVDIEEGINAGCGIVVAVTTGAYTKDELIRCHPDFIIDSLEKLPSLIY
jgi:phosphonatase-like hydrolase